MILPALASPPGLALTAAPRVAGGESAGDFGGTLAALLDTGLVADVAPADFTDRQPAVSGGKPLPDAAAEAETLPFWSPGVAFVQVPVAAPPPLVAATVEITAEVPASVAAAALAPAALGTSALTPVKSPLASSLVGGGGDVPIEGPDPAPVENRLPPPSERVIRIGLRGTERPTTAKRPRDFDATDDTPTEHATIPGAAPTAVPVVADAPQVLPPAAPQATLPEAGIGTATLAGDAFAKSNMPGARQASPLATMPEPLPAAAFARDAGRKPPALQSGIATPATADTPAVDETPSSNSPPPPSGARPTFAAASDFQVAAAILSGTRLVALPDTPSLPAGEALPPPAAFNGTVMPSPAPGTPAQAPALPPAVAADSASADTPPPQWSSRDGAPPVTLVVQLPPAAATQPQPGTVASAAQVFGAAIQAAAQRRDEPRLRDDTTLLAPLTAAGTVHALAPTTDAQAPLDMRQERWPSAMIERIDILRDAANATDTRIRLIPDALGTIDVSVRKDGDTLHVHFAAEQAATRSLLQEAQPRLAELADARGMKLTQSNVDTGAGQQQQQRTATPHQPSAPARPRAGTATAADTDPTDTRLA
ncbi:flagellar hook-length control protein FliK [Sphingomonas sp. CFBP 13706]|uniref:flagellar hook-length control protein FliK n=1 Tax=Sphingomonas sp. CFBP 13706 TaxID=2775314 RepID=UPI0017832D1E|nr:flagellar hook-length control protein FliK [Sphingomonas sp. CFBP 13706]MBD8736717.1 flagellar hook-length control protein FliK [Sphingomonas sp. CFBP 13706]